MNVQERLQANIQLQVGAATETVTVTGTPPQLQTTEASVGQVIDSTTLNSLPLNGRNFTFLAQLSAGELTRLRLIPEAMRHQVHFLRGMGCVRRRTTTSSMASTTTRMQSTFWNGTNFVILPPLDAIQEFKVQTAQFSAEQGRSAGAVLNATIKSEPIAFTALSGSFSGTTSWMPPIGLKTRTK